MLNIKYFIDFFYFLCDFTLCTFIKYFYCASNSLILFVSNSADVAITIFYLLYLEKNSSQNPILFRKYSLQPSFFFCKKIKIERKIKHASGNLANTRWIVFSTNNSRYSNSVKYIFFFSKTFY